MKQLTILLAIGTLSTSLCQAMVFFSEGFDYADGTLTTVSGGNWVRSGGETNEVQVSSGKVALSHTAAGHEDVKRDFGATVDSGSVYASFNFSVDALAPAAGLDFEAFAHFSTNDEINISRVDVVAPNADGDFSLGISAGPFAEITWATDLTYNTTYSAVMRYNVDTQLSTLWINPSSESATSITTGVEFGSNQEVISFNLRQSDSDTTETITIDNIVTGTTFADVAPIPEPSTYALLGGMIVSGIALLRRRASK